MYLDLELAVGRRLRTAAHHGANVLFDAWSGASNGARAAMIAAHGELALASACAGGGWTALVDGDPVGALKSARQDFESPGMAFLETEALFFAGAVVPALRRLESMHERGDAAATLALARRRYQLGDHAGAVRAAQRLPHHVHAALTGARAAVAIHRVDLAYRFIDPFLHGVAPVPESAAAGSLATTAASVLAGMREYDRLRGFVDRLLVAGDLPEQMMPAVGRVAWIGGRAREAWNRFKATNSPWSVAARLELAILTGNARLAERLAEHAGPLAEPSMPAVRLLGGDTKTGRSAVELSAAARSEEADREVFADGRTVHVWRTHPHRWQPWIDAALHTPADVTVCDLAAGRLPDPEVLPEALVDDGALLDMLDPVPVPVAALRGTGVAIGRKLCTGMGIGHDWPEQETEVMRERLPVASSPAEAAVWVLGVDDALPMLHTGRAAVVVAPPGDPFWASPVPEKTWPSIRVVRSDAQAGWNGAGARVVEAVEDLLQPAAGG